MPTVLWPRVCAFDVPKGWTWETVEGVIAVYREDSSGVLEVAIVFGAMSAEDVLQKELARFPGAKVEGRSAAGHEARAHVTSGSKEWTLFALMGTGKGAAITYHPSGDPREGDTVEHLIDSFQWV